MRSTSALLGIVPLALMAALLPQDPRAPLELARAEHGRPPEREERVRIPEIAVLVGGEIVVDGDAMPFRTVKDAKAVRRALVELSRRIPRTPDDLMPSVTWPDRPVVVRVDRRVQYTGVGLVVGFLGAIDIELALVELEVVDAESGETGWLRLSQPNHGVAIVCYEGELLELQLASPGAPSIDIHWRVSSDLARLHRGASALRFESADDLLRFMDGGEPAGDAQHLIVQPSTDATWQAVVSALDALVGAGHSVELQPVFLPAKAGGSPR